VIVSDLEDLMKELAVDIAFQIAAKQAEQEDELFIDPTRVKTDISHTTDSFITRFTLDGKPIGLMKVLIKPTTKPDKHEGFISWVGRKDIRINEDIFKGFENGET